MKKLICINDTFHPIAKKVMEKLPVKNNSYIIDGKCPITPNGVHLKNFNQIIILGKDTPARVSFKKNRFVDVDTYIQNQTEKEQITKNDSKTKTTNSTRKRL